VPSPIGNGEYSRCLRSSMTENLRLITPGVYERGSTVERPLETTPPALTCRARLRPTRPAARGHPHLLARAARFCDRGSRFLVARRAILPHRNHVADGTPHWPLAREIRGFEERARFIMRDLAHRVLPGPNPARKPASSARSSGCLLGVDRRRGALEITLLTRSTPCAR